MDFLKSTNISPCVLEQKDIASYIPYGLKVQDRDLDIWLLSQLGNVDPCMDGDVGLCCDGGDCQQYDYLSDIKPILRPMSDLVKEITHRGQTFVPMVEIAKLLGYSGLVRCKNGGHVAYGFGMTYLDDSPGYLIDWNSASGSFSIWYDDDFASSPMADMLFNMDALDMLSQWMFDYRGLISVDLALDVNTFVKNPYEL